MSALEGRADIMLMNGDTRLSRCISVPKNAVSFEFVANWGEVDTLSDEAENISMI